jgi:hypothetical protein
MKGMVTRANDLWRKERSPFSQATQQVLKTEEEKIAKTALRKRSVATTAKGAIIICETRGNKLPEKRRAVDAIDPRIQVYSD